MRFFDLIEQLKSCFEPISVEGYKGEFGYVVNCEDEVRRVGFATNLDQITAARAIEEEVDALITHHDAWDFLYELRERAHSMLKSASISHCFVHLPLDAASFGTAVSLADGLGLKIVDSFALLEGLPCGRIGEYPSPESLQTVASRLRRVTGDSARVWAHTPAKAKRVAVVPGAGNLNEVIKEAADMKCDTYITGETSLYSVQYARYRGINQIVGTHTHTEFPGVERLCHRLQGSTGVEFVPIREEEFEIGTRCE